MERNGESDQERLIAAVAEGDEEGFGALYDCFGRSLYALGLRMLQDTGAAEELVQDTMMKVWRSAGGFDPTKGSVSTWIFTLARRTGIDLIRKRGRTPVPSELHDNRADLGAEEQREWRDWEIGVLLSELSTEQRVVVEMCVIDGYTQSEAAERLEIPLGTVKTRVYAGLRHLRLRLKRLEVLEGTS